MEAQAVEGGVSPGKVGTLRRDIDWTHAFWFAAGTPALVLFSVGAIAATVGNISPLVWIISTCFGFIQCFTYAEIAGIFPHKSGGASVYGAIAWVRYGKLLGPISVWSNWFSWSPVLAIGTGLSAGYILNLLFPADSLINTWEITVLDLGFVKDNLSLRINSTFVLGWILVLAVFAIQHRGVLRAAKAQMFVAISALVPLLLIGIIPIVTGDLPRDHFTPFVPLSYNNEGNPVAGSWDMAGWTVFVGGLFIAAWSTYAFETAVCYTREFRNPGRDTVRAIGYAGLLCLVVFSLVPIAFQGFLGLEGMLAPGIYNGDGVGKVMASMVGAGPVLGNVIVVMLILALLLVVMTAMAGSSRTLYQGSIDGWLPKYLSKVNHNGAPVAAMWTDLGFNMLLLMMSDYVFLLALANVNYIVFIFLNLQSGWMHRIDSPKAKRPFRCPNWLLGMGAILGFVNLAFLGMGANIWGAGTLTVGLLVAAAIIPVFAFRHYITDGGVFPEQMYKDMMLAHGEDGTTIEKRCGMLPYLTLGAAVAVVIFFHTIAVY
ncbi:APC family permease [Ferruginivarius sediminum]|uniref:APC family permease n=1 Tax=Ferruginivarius sediminum TaxID=2661937 RepID=A0A369TCH5_9PROT|nr:APC family permease [Ferruginivarius sediminum]RDD62988.1 APC family permease [Ferruginivarius sediminum]